MVQIVKRITAQTYDSLEALIQEKSSFMVQWVLHFRSYKGTNSVRTKFYCFCFLGSCFMSTSTIRDATSTLAYQCNFGHLFPDIVCLSFVHVNFTICPWGIITFRMCMSSRPHCCHWTAYKGLRTGLLLSSALCYSPPALQAVTNLSLQHDL